MEQDVVIWVILAGLAERILAISVTLHAVLNKRDTRAVIGWVGLAWLAPVLGSFAYFWFGINRIRRNRSVRKRKGRWEASRAAGNHRTDGEALHLPHESAHLGGLIRLSDRIAQQPLTAGNRIEPLMNGDETFPSMLDAIRNAHYSITLLSYIFECDETGYEFLKELSAAVARGVQVRVLIDDVGSRYGHSNIISELNAAGVRAAAFLPTRIPRIPQYANLRNHRKILVVDGHIGFTGGTNIRHSHVLGDNPSYPTACTHFRVQGPVVDHMQEVFAFDWEFTTGEKLTGSPWFETHVQCGNTWARGISHGPDEDFEKLTQVLAGALSVAERRVRILTPYFLPEVSLIQALNLAALRGVKVEILVPEQNNVVLVQWAMQAQLWQNLERGCRIWFVPPPFDHSKLMVVDDVWTLLGSTNWDPRSLRLNFEFNIECYDVDLAAKVNRIIDDKATLAREITLTEVDSRSTLTRIRDGICRLAIPYL
ncbi:MAG: cardiolipin synthase [Planctomyces sp.]|nr:cardiolipin synthase [Planctomyces sp.]